MENAIKISTRPHSFTLPSGVEREVWAECLPYAREIYHYLPTSSTYIPSIQRHEATHISDAYVGKFWFDIFFLDFLRRLIGKGTLPSTTKVYCGDLLFTFARCDIQPLDAELTKLMEASAIYSQVMDTSVHTPSELKQKIIEDLRIHRRSTFDYFQEFLALSKKLVKHLSVRNKAEEKHALTRLKQLIVFQLLKSNFENRLQVRDALETLHALLDDKMSHKLLSRRTGSTYATIAEAISEILIKKIKVRKHREANSFRTLLLFLMSCFKNDQYDSILKHYAFGLGEALNCFQVVFRGYVKTTVPSSYSPFTGTSQRFAPPPYYEFVHTTFSPLFPVVSLHVPYEGETEIISCTGISHDLLGHYRRYLKRKEPIFVKVPQHLKHLIKKKSATFDATRNFIAAYRDIFEGCPKASKDPYWKMICEGKPECPLKDLLYYKIKDNWKPFCAEVIDELLDKHKLIDKTARSLKTRVLRISGQPREFHYKITLV